MARRRKTEVERIIEFLEREGFRPVTEADKGKPWYKAAMAPVDCFEENRTQKEAEKDAASPAAP